MPVPFIPSSSSKLRAHWPLAAVIVAYLATMLVVPVLTPAAIGDDWVYARAAYILLREGRLRILEPAAAVSVFEAIWGAAFAWLFGFSFGVLRLSTVLLTAASGVGAYGLATSLGAHRMLATVGAALQLFNPLHFVLSYTFMTDPHFTALATLSGWCYVRGLQRDVASPRFVISGSAFAALALLSRHQGVLLPATVVLYLLVARRIRLSRGGVFLVLQVVALPLSTAIGYASWLLFFRGVPAAQADFAGNIGDLGVGGLVLLAGRHAFIQPMYLGLFLLPVIVAMLFGLGRVVRALRPTTIAIVAVSSLGLVSALRSFQDSPRTMPYLRSYFNHVGLGPYDVLVPPGPTMSGPVVALMTAGSLIGAVGVIVLLSTWFAKRSIDDDQYSDDDHAREVDRSSVLLVALFLVVMALGALPQSATFAEATVSGANIPGLDRYLLPTLPFAIAISVAAAGRLRLPWVVMAGAALPMAAFAVAGTHDSLEFQRTVWDTGHVANRLGVVNTRLDAGAAWDGHYLFEYSVAQKSPVRTPNGPWWTVIFAPATDSSYVVGTAPLPGWAVVHEQPYSSWLQRAPTKMYLLRRPEVIGPP